MDPHRGIHHRLFNKRQGLGGVLGNLIPTASTSSTAKAATPTASQSTGDPFGIIGGFTSILGDASSVFVPPSGPSSTAISGTPLTLSSSSSAGSTTTPASSVQTTASTSPTTSSSTSTTSTSTTPTPTPTPTHTSTSPAANTVYTSSDGNSVVYITTQLPAASPTAAPHPSFLQDSSLEGGIFALVGIVFLVIVFIVVTWTIRNRRRARLERDLAAAVTFDPGATDHYERQEHSMEKHRLSASSSGHGHGYGYGMQPAYLPQLEYHGPMGYRQYPVAAYHAPSSNPTPYQVPSPAVPQPAGQGGANLTRKFSDRKPVPPLLPNPAYDPSNTHVSFPPQLYHQ